MNEYYLYIDRNNKVVGGTNNTSMAKTMQRNGYSVSQVSKETFDAELKKLQQEKLSREKQERRLRKIRKNIRLLSSVLFTISILIFFLYIHHMRYLACMELFQSFWYCALR